MAQTVDLTRRKTPFTLSDVLALQAKRQATRLRVRDDQRDHLLGLLREQHPALVPDGTIVWNGMEVVG